MKGICKYSESMENNNTQLFTFSVDVDCRHSWICSSLITFVLVFDDKDGDAARQRWHRRKTRGEAPSVSAMSQVLLKQPPAGAAHQVSGPGPVII